MALSEYEVTVNGVTTTMALSEDEAKEIPGAKQVGSFDQVRTASEDRQADEAEPVSAQYDQAQGGKSRTTATKKAGAQQDKSA